MDDLDKWRDQNECVVVLLAGVNYLFELLQERHRNSNLVAHIRQVGDLKLSLERRHGPTPPASLAEEPELECYLTALNDLGTVGYGLWHLRSYMDSPGFRREFDELSKLGDPDNPVGNELRLRGQGFLFYAVGVFAREGFGVEFILPSAKQRERRPDVLLVRDGVRFPCEVTTRKPRTATGESVGEFWAQINGVVEKKQSQFKGTDYDNGVLMVDCSPVFHLLKLGDIPIGASLMHLPDGNGPPGGEVPLIRYDASEFSKGLREFQHAITGTRIRTLVLWNRGFEVKTETFRRILERRIIGTIGGGRFWAYFPEAIVFPGPDVDVTWDAL
jgi:hypothetical protein